jgi:hypothetical protein
VGAIKNFPLKDFPFPHGSQLSTVCLFTVGASAPTINACQLLEEIDRPASATFALTAPPQIPRSLLRMVCARVVALRAKCLDTQRKVGSAAIDQVISGVVRDGITSLDVYARVKGVRKLLLDVPVHNNVYSFRTGGAVSGPLSLVFRNAGGQAVQTTPTMTGTIKGTVIGTTTPMPVPTLPRLARSVKGTAIPLPSPPRSSG